MIVRDGLKLVGWVANTPTEKMTCHAENVATLERLLPAPLIGEVPYETPFNPENSKKYLNIQQLIDI